MTDVVAWPALAMSGPALGWQVVTWVRSGARIKFGVLAGDVVVTEGKVTMMIFFTATNAGRLAATVHNVGIEQRMHRFGRRIRIVGPGVLSGLDSVSPPALPYRLEPHDSVVGRVGWQSVPLRPSRRGRFGYLVPCAYVGGRTVTAQPIRAKTAYRMSHPE